MTARRLPQGGEIDRTQPLTFSFDGRVIHAFQGDTLASALLAAGSSAESVAELEPPPPLEQAKEES